MRVRPLHNVIVVQPDEEPSDEIPGSVLVKPEQAHNEITTMATVVAVSKGVWERHKVDGKVKYRRRPIQVSPGDRVCYIKYLRETQTNQILSWVIGTQLLIKEEDIIYVEVQ